jgi:DNA polymerase I-like protein with 3'-5' exonuclease and polymerase domains
VDERKLKDLVNSVCQSTGHDCLVYMINWSFARFKELGIHAEPVLADLHDAIFVECPEADAAAVQYVLETEAYEALNTWLGWDIKLRGAAKVCRTWKDDKIGD